jgi:hypothetical protein
VPWAVGRSFRACDGGFTLLHGRSEGLPSELSQVLSSHCIELFQPMYASDNHLDSGSRVSRIPSADCAWVYQLQLSTNIHG